MQHIIDRVANIKSKLEPYGATLVAVSKFRSLPEIQALVTAGQQDLGENRVQEMAEKQEHFAQYPLRWHQIGTLQRNKVKYIAPFVHLVQAVDNWELLAELQKQAAKHNRIIPFLFQLHIAKEETKFGFAFNELLPLLSSQGLAAYPHLELKGLMGMATNTADAVVVRKEFAGLKKHYDELASAGMPMQILSMGMSQDWQLALEEGSTMVRIGSALFLE